MMRRLLAALLPVLLLAAGCGSGGGGTSTGLALGRASWKDGDRVVYDWLDKSGNRIGTEEIVFARDGQAWVLTETDKIGDLNQVAKVRIDADTLKPLGEEKTIDATGTAITVTTTYAGGKLDIKAVVNGENRSATIDVPADALDNDQLLMTLRALKFEQGYEGKYVNVVGMNAAKIDTIVRLTGKEKVDVPAGSFNAWRVELDFGQAKQHAWYQVEAPNDMVQYDNGTTKAVLTKQ